MEEEVKPKVYTIKGNKYYLPPEVDYVQWKHVKDLFKKADIKLTDIAQFRDGKPIINLGNTASNVLQKLSDQNVVPEFFATILIPEGETLWEEDMIKNAEDMKRIGDVTMGEVLVSFLLGRESLAYTIINFLMKFLSKMPEFEKKSVD